MSIAPTVEDERVNEMWRVCVIDCVLKDAEIARLREALRGDPDSPESISPLSWLRSAIDELKKRGPANDDEDPSAYWEMVNELVEFEAKARNALSERPTQSDEEKR